MLKHRKIRCFFNGAKYTFAQVTDKTNALVETRSRFKAHPTPSGLLRRTTWEAIVEFGRGLPLSTNALCRWKALFDYINIVDSVA